MPIRAFVNKITHTKEESLMHGFETCSVFMSFLLCSVDLQLATRMGEAFTTPNSSGRRDCML